jgi:hypothetical protein
LPSSTSSSEWASRRVALAVLSVLVALELFTRVNLFQRSKDFRRYGGYGEAAGRLAAAPSGELSVALIGNSATQYGIDRDLLGRVLAARCARPVRVEVFTADASRINTWHFMLESEFWHPGRRADLFVINFYEDDLADGNRIEIGRLAQFFTGVRDWPAVFATDLAGFAERAEFVVASFWATYAARARIRERVLGLIPGYKDYLARANAVLYRHEHAAVGALARGPARYRALERLLARARRRTPGSQLVFVAYPTLEAATGRPYALDPAAAGILQRAGAALVDFRRLPRIGPDLYMDDIHLGEAGRELYTQELAAALPCAGRR